MRVALHDADKMDFPNLALMKISAFHKACGDVVEWYQPGGVFDAVYSSKVFTFTPEDPTLPPWTIKGGTGYDIHTVLPAHIDGCYPDYSLYECEHGLGFLTRGCIRSCPWCFVPLKEGAIRAESDIENIVGHGLNSAVLMDNNVLAHEHGIRQIEKIARLGIKVDFNQGLDARLIDDAMARLLRKVKWLRPLRLACDSVGMIEPVRKAIETLRWHNVVPRAYFCYVLIDDVDDALQRLRFLKGMNVDPFAQPFMPMEGGEPTRAQRRLARWVNLRQAYKAMTWEEYRDMQGDRI